MPPTAAHRAAPALLAALLAGASAACGARTGLLVPDVASDAARLRDVTVDATAVDVERGFDACVPGRFTLQPRRAEVLFLLDRSDSMLSPLDGNDPFGLTRGRALRNALAEALPPFQAAVDLGALMFPNQRPCVVAGPLEVAPAAGTAGRIVSAYQAAGTDEGTPTFDALEIARRYFTRPDARAGARYIVLATDGGPVCNEALDPVTCECLFPESGQPCRRRFCLDDRRTLDAIGAARDMGIPTYVVGIDDPTEPVLIDVLDRMAVAGGRARMESPRYYSVRRAADLAAALTGIQRSITRCVFFLPSRPDAADDVAVLRDGAPVRRDPARRDGWDWTTRERDELTLFGPACEMATTSSVVTAEVACR